MSESELIGGIYPRERNENAPDFVIGKFSIRIDQFRDWMKDHLAANPGEEWINVDMNMSKGGKPYAVLNTWKPEQKSEPASDPAPEQPPVDDDLPF